MWLLTPANLATSPGKALLPCVLGHLLPLLATTALQAPHLLHDAPSCKPPCEVAESPSSPLGSSLLSPSLPSSIQLSLMLPSPSSPSLPPLLLGLLPSSDADRLSPGPPPLDPTLVLGILRLQDFPERTIFFFIRRIYSKRTKGWGRWGAPSGADIYSAKANCHLPRTVMTNRMGLPVVVAAATHLRCRRQPRRTPSLASSLVHKARAGKSWNTWRRSFPHNNNRNDWARMGHLRSCGVLRSSGVVHLGRGVTDPCPRGGFTNNSSSLIAISMVIYYILWRVEGNR